MSIASTTNSAAASASAASSSANLAALSATSGTPTTAAGTSAMFLTLLVAQMKNQDPLNPMDNSQMTTQLAEIQTVEGVSTLNTTMQGLSTQMVQMQALQAASLVGKQVTVPGNDVTVAGGVGTGGFQLASAASDVSIQVLSASGQVLGTMDLGAQPAGVGSFSWPAGAATATSGLTFKVSATSGGTAVTSTALMQDTVNSVSTSGTTLMLDLQNSGNVPYTTVQALN
jgi:flagellar basal-body rod modification protein FlgD